MNLYVMFGSSVLIQVCLALIDSIKDELILMTMEDALCFLKDNFRELKIIPSTFLSKALSFNQVSYHLLSQLENIYKKKKNKRVLFFKD